MKRRLSLLLSAVLAVGCGSEFNSKGDDPAEPSAGAGGSAGTSPQGSGGSAPSTAGQGGGAGSPGPEPGGVLAIPAEHPRLFFNAERLEGARQWFEQNPFEPGTATDAISATDAALHYLLTGNEDSAASAIAWALSVEVDTSGNGSDIARWDGEAVILVYDWCHAAMSDADRELFVQRWNVYLSELNAQDWGGVGMEGNNYYLGNVRNTLEWGIATHGENAEAEAFLAYGLETRWRDSFLPYADEFGKGGVMHEGSAYGRRVLAYWTVPLVSASLFGRNLWDETPFFRESLYWLIYSTTPGLTEQQSGDGSVSVYETWPSNEDERWLERDLVYNTAQTTLGDYLTPLLAHYAGLPVAGHVAAFLERTETTAESRFVAAAATSEPARDLAELPLDYFAEGLGMAYAKTSWDGSASALQVQVSTPVGVGHNHLDAGTFQLWRKGRFVTRETVGYAQLIAGYADSARDCRDTVGHNGLLYDGRGSIDWQNGRPETLALSSGDDHFYIAMDLSEAYTIRDDQAHREQELVDGLPLGNPGAGRTLREFLFIKPLETLVVLDRMEADGEDPSAVTKTFLVHFPAQPEAPSPDVYLAQTGDQTLRVTTALPLGTTRRVVAEGGDIGQFRAEIEASGSTETLFLHVLEMRDAGEAALTIQVEQTASGHRLILQDAARGTAHLEFDGGVSATGGAFGYAMTGEPSVSALRDGVQELAIDVDGVRWSP
ncbi:MAG TPA: heparinase II/III family protein [Polyangiaceae bacterium]|nr:heparinase II/III family protein [Polyangiaceae bacterium]